MSRKGKKFRQFDPLLKQILRSLKGQCALLDGEIVVLDAERRSNFFDLMGGRGEPRYYAFDLVWLNARDLRAPHRSGERQGNRASPNTSDQRNTAPRSIQKPLISQPTCSKTATPITCHASPGRIHCFLIAFWNT